jgi:hypothetical protein
MHEHARKCAYAHARARAHADDFDNPLGCISMTSMMLMTRWFYSLFDPLGDFNEIHDDDQIYS